MIKPSRSSGVVLAVLYVLDSDLVMPYGIKFK